jgi:hypothetical protein
MTLTAVTAVLVLFLLFLAILFMLVVGVVAEPKLQPGEAEMVAEVAVAPGHNMEAVLEVYLGLTVKVAVVALTLEVALAEPILVGVAEVAAMMAVEIIYPGLAVLEL